MNFDLELDGCRTLVTGGSKGVGAAVVAALRSCGAKVIASARSVPDTVSDGVHFVAADLTTAAGCAALADAVLGRFGGVDVIVNVLGGSNAPAGGFAVLDDDTWFSELNQNLMPAVRVHHGDRVCH